MFDSILVMRMIKGSVKYKGLILFILLTVISISYLLVLEPLDANLDEIIYNKFAYTGDLKDLPQLAHHALFHVLEYSISFITNPLKLMPLDGIKYLHIIVFICLTYFIYSIPLRYIKNKSLAFISALIFAVSFDNLEQTMGGEPMLLALFFLIFGYFVIKPVEKPVLIRYTIGGVLFGLSVLTHQLTLPCVGGALLFLLFMSFKERERRKPLVVLFSIFLGVLAVGYSLIARLAVNITNFKDGYLWFTYWSHKQLNIIGIKRLLFLPLTFIRPFFKGQAIADYINYSTFDWRLIPAIFTFISVSILLVYILIKLFKDFRNNVCLENRLLRYFILIPMVLETIGIMLFMTHNFEYSIVVVAHLVILLPLVFDISPGRLIKRSIIALFILLLISNTLLEFIPKSRILPINAPCYQIEKALEKENIETGDMVISTFAPKYSMLIEVKSNYEIIPVSMDVMMDFAGIWKVDNNVLSRIDKKIENVRLSGGRVFLTGEVIDPPRPKINIFNYTTYPYGYELGKIWKDKLIDTGHSFLFQGRNYKIYEFK